MKGYYPVVMPTKKYIKAYILAQLGPQPLMNTDNVIGSKLYDVIQHSPNKEVVIKQNFEEKETPPKGGV